VGDAANVDNVAKVSASRRGFLARGAAGAASVGAAVMAGGVAQQAHAQSQPQWDKSADVIVIGAGVAGLPAAISVRDNGASVIVVDSNHDIGGRGILSGGRIHLGGGHALQQKLGIKDTPDQIFADWVRHDHADSRYSDRELVRVFADENVPTYDFLVANGVKLIEKLVGPEQSSTIPRTFLSVEWDVPAEVIAPRYNRNGSGIVRALAASARSKGAEILLQHKMTSLIREKPRTGKILGIAVTHNGKTLHIQANKGVIITTGGHTGNVNFRRMFDPRLTEEYQQACQPWVHQNADGEIAAMELGAALWSTANQTTETGAAITKTRHIGCQWGYSSLVYAPDSPMFKFARATGLTVKDWQNVVMVNDRGQRFWNEADGSYDFFAAAMAWNGDPQKLNGGGPIWAIFDAEAAAREKWNTQPPNVDPAGYFFSADTLAELAGKIKNPYQRRPISGATLQASINRYNTFVTAGKDADFNKPTPMHKIQTPPFYAAWSTPILHDTLTGLRTNRNSEVVDISGSVIPGLYCAGEAQGGFSQHGLARCLVFGRVAGRHAAKRAG
jgi:succinate dehydrogenase/fumarate reductase flavoprotein subunit